MGYYLNPEDIIDIYKREAAKPYFVDKTDMLVEYYGFTDKEADELYRCFLDNCSHPTFTCEASAITGKTSCISAGLK